MCTGRSGSTLTAKQAAGIRYLLSLELKRVKLGGQLARRAERFLSMLACSENVEELVIDGAGLEDGMGTLASLEWDESILYRFPSLKTVELANLELDIIPPSTHPSSAPIPINHLILTNVDLASGSFLCQMGVSISSLSICAKSASEYDEQVRLALENFGLQALSYQVCSSGTTERTFLPDANMTSSLRRLALDGYADSAFLAEIALRCAELEELHITGRTVAVTALEWTEFMRTFSAPASLKRLGLPGGANMPPFVKWSVEDTDGIHAVAASQGIQLVN